MTEYMGAVVAMYKLLALPFGFIALCYIGVLLIEWWERR